MARTEVPARKSHNNVTTADISKSGSSHLALLRCPVTLKAGFIILVKMDGTVHLVMTHSVGIRVGFNDGFARAALSRNC